jgi:hypothetical protein
MGSSSPHQAAAAAFSANIQHQQQNVSPNFDIKHQMPPPTPNGMQNFIYPWMRPTGNVKTSSF